MKILILGISCLFLLSLPSRSLAEEGACTMDVQKYCDGVQPGDGRIMKCLKDHEHELSQGCKTESKEVKTKLSTALKGFMKACKDDLKKHCSGVKRGEGRIRDCLVKQGKAGLAPECAAALGL